MKISPFVVFAMLLALTHGPTDSYAATRVLSDPYVTDFEFYDNGLYYWGNSTGPGCGGEFSPVSTLGTLGNRGPKFKDPGGFNPVMIGATRNYWSPCGPMLPLGVARNDDYLFVCDRNGVSRFPAYLFPLAPLPAPDPIGNRFNMEWPGAMLVFEDQLYFVASYTSTVSDGTRNLGRFQVYSLPATNATLLTPVSLVADGGGMQSLYLGRVKKFRTMVVRRFSPLGFDVDVTVGLILGDSGSLVRFDIYPGILAGRPPALLAHNVADFDVRNESRFSGGFIQFRDHLYAAVNSEPVLNDFSCAENGRLVEIDGSSGAQTQLWPRAGENLGRLQVTAVELDSYYVFLNTRAVFGPFPPFGGCSVGQAVIRSKLDRAHIIFVGGADYPDPDYQAVEIGGGSNLRSDNHWLYFTRSNAIWRITNAAPPLRLDFAAVGLEAVQVIQDFNNSVRLVEGKRTVVRGYAREVENTTGNSNWRPTGQLRGWRNGVEIPGSPLFANNSPALLTTTDLNAHRGNITNNFLFELPADWVRSGILTLEFSVNPNGSVYESGNNPFGNNYAAADLTVVQVPRPCFVFAALKTTDAPNYWPWENSVDFNNIVARATSLLPVPSLDIRFTTEQVSDVEFIGDCGFFCHDPFDFSQNDDWNEALSELADYDNFDRPPPGCPRASFVGGIHPNANTAWGGLAYTPGNHLLNVMSAIDNNSTFNTFWGGRTLAHEFGHNLGRQHINQLRDNPSCGGNRPDRPDGMYPFNSCTFGPTDITQAGTPVGFDTVTLTPVLPSQAGDLLSYAPVRWPSTYTYNAMLDALGPSGPALAAAPPASPAAGPYVLLRGLLNVATRQVKLRPCYSVPDALIDPIRLQQSFDAAAGQAHDYLIQQLDAGDTVLSESPLIVEIAEDGDNVTAVLNQFVVKDPAATSLRIIKAGVPLAECRASASEPVLTGVTATYDATGLTLAVQIQASDADGDVLFHTVQFSNDDGTSWRLLKLNTALNAFVSDARRLPGGDSCRLRVFTTDGFHTAVTLSDPFVIERRAPEILIGGMKPGQRVAFGANIQVTAIAVDPEDGTLPNANCSWDIAGPTPLAVIGASFNTRSLSPGDYTATVSATDSDGNTATSSVAFQVASLVIGDAPAPIVDGDVADAAYESATPVLLEGGATARFTHAPGYLYAGFSGLKLGTGEYPSAVGVHVDADASGDATPQPGDRAFFVSEHGNAWQLEGDGAGFVAPPSVVPGFKGVVTRGAGGWNAEMRIPESLVGGWEHPVRLEIELDGGECIFILFSEICFPTVAYWPPSADPNSPTTWINAYLGTPPTPANQPPVALASPNLVTVAGTVQFLNGSSSYDPDGDPITFAWTQTDGPPIALDNATSATPRFTVPASAAPQTIRLQLVVNDGQLDSAPAEVVMSAYPVEAPSVGAAPGIVINEGTASGQILVNGRPGSTVRIQASTDLETWTDLGTQLVGMIPVILFQDAEAGLYPHRFYRAIGGASTITTNAGNALSLDGTGARVEVPHEDSLNAYPLTVAFWLNSTDSDAAVRGLVSKYGDASLNGYSLFLHQGHVRGWYFADGANFIWDGALGLDGGWIADGQWHRIALVIDDTGGHIYVDGSPTGSLPWFGSPAATTTTEPLQFGHYSYYAEGLSGQLDDISVWNRAFSRVQLLDLMNFSPMGDEAGLLGLWRFDEEDTEGPTTGDSSGHGQVGTLTGSAVRTPSTAPVRR